MESHFELWFSCMTAHSSLSGKSWISGCTDQVFSNERGSLNRSFWIRGSSNQLFHMSWVTEERFISNAIGLWELYFRSIKLNCTCVLKWRSQKYVGCHKSRFSVISAHIKRAGMQSRSSQESGRLKPTQILEWELSNTYIGCQKLISIDNKCYIRNL